ncbi:MAG: LLM class flavin-dependent oxidoreductase [Thermodesulfobacteriota bacterium]
MKFGMGPFSLQPHPEKPDSRPEVYRETLEQVQLAEKLTFDSGWLSEHHFLPDGYCPSVLVATSATLILPTHNSVRVAEDAAV